MLQHLRPALAMILGFTLLTGVAYPLAITGIAWIMLHDAALGSLLVGKDGKVVGSSLIGQSFTSDRYFHPRPSATTGPDPADPSKSVDAPYNAAASTGSNLGPLTQKLIDRVKGDVAALRAQGPRVRSPSTPSRPRRAASTPTSRPRPQCLQVPRVAKARALPEEHVRALVNAARSRAGRSASSASRTSTCSPSTSRSTHLTH